MDDGDNELLSQPVYTR